MNPTKNKDSTSKHIANIFTVLGVLWSLVFITFSIYNNANQSEFGTSNTLGSGLEAIFYGSIIFGSLGLILLLNTIFIIIQAFRRGQHIKQALLTILFVLFVLLGTEAMMWNL